MTIPSFDKPSNLLLFIGIGILLYALSFQIKSGENLDKKYYEGSLKTLQLKYDIKLDSSECESLNKKINRLRSDSTSSIEEIRIVQLAIDKKLILNSKRAEEINIINSNINRISNQYEWDSTGFWPIFIIILSFIFIGMGIVLLVKEYELKTSNDNTTKKMTNQLKSASKERLKKYFKNK
ncbi:MAG: hypothetical protein Q8M29_02905 [Bacteroidota bacterium]|nr:hypothetical protein [Bacteroidota bacterium]